MPPPETDGEGGGGRSQAVEDGHGRSLYPLCRPAAAFLPFSIKSPTTRVGVPGILDRSIIDYYCYFMTPRQPSALQRELRQRRPFPSLSQEAVVALFRTVDLVRRAVTEEIAEMGITLQQYNVLRILRGAGPAGLPTLEVADRMIEQAPGITRMMDRLEGHGWVTRERCPTDRREVHCRITPAGLDLLARLDNTIDEIDHRALGSLDDARLRQLIRLLDDIRAAHTALPAYDVAEAGSKTRGTPRTRAATTINRR